MKKMTAILLALLLTAGLPACKSGEGGKDSGTNGTGGGDDPIVVSEEKTEPQGSTAPTESGTEPGTAPETEPPAPEVPASGYCAVGEVDADGKRAAVLFGNGLVKTMTYAGDAPAPGSVLYFETEGDLIAFAAVALSDYSQWRVFSDPSGDHMYSTDLTSEWRHYFDEAAVGFLKFSDTEWRVFSGKTMMKIAADAFEYPGTAYPSNLWAYDGDGNTTLDLIFADATKQYDNGEVKDVTLLFSGDKTGFAAGDKTVTIQK